MISPKLRSAVFPSSTSIALAAAIVALPAALRAQVPTTDNAGQAAPTNSGSTAPNPQRSTARNPFPTVTAQKLALAPVATYDNRYEIFGGINFENFQAGQDLPKRMNFAGAEAQGTYWFGNHLGGTASYRFEGGTTPVLPNNRYNRPAIFQHNFLGGATWRGPKGRYAAIDYHALAGGSYGIFDHAFGDSSLQGSAPIPPSAVGLYTNRLAFMAALGGSVDFNYTKNLAIRIAPDLILEHYGTELREFVYVSGGIMYRFGKRL